MHINSRSAFVQISLMRTQVPSHPAKQAILRNITLRWKKYFMTTCPVFARHQVRSIATARFILSHKRTPCAHCQRKSGTTLLCRAAGGPGHHESRCTLHSLHERQALISARNEVTSATQSALVDALTELSGAVVVLAPEAQPGVTPSTPLTSPPLHASPIRHFLLTLALPSPNA